MDYQDKTIECVDCGEVFVHTADDQARYAARGLQHEPKRCPTCRQANRAGQKGRGKRNRGASPDTSTQDKQSSPDKPRTQEQSPLPPSPPVEISPQQMVAPSWRRLQTRQVPRNEANWPDPEKYTYTVPCAECGRETTVPFKPTDNPPVLCKSCFLAKLPAG